MAAALAGLALVALATAILVPGALRADTSPAREAGRKAVTFSRDVAPIVYKNCSACHRPGEVAPFSLLTYQDVKKRAKQLALVTESKVMPPWKAEPGFGAFKDARCLTPAQIGTIREWVSQGAQEGRSADLPPSPKFGDGWSLGQPDAIIEPPQEYTLDAEGRDVYRNFVIPTSFGADRWVSAIEVRPGNRRVVHHVLVFLDTTGTARKMDGKDGQPGYSTFGGVGFLPAGGLGGWAPGNTQRPLPDGVGMDLPKGADVVIQVHYHKGGKVEKDRTRIGLHFAKGPVDKRFRWVPVLNPFLYLKPGEENQEVRASMPVPFDATLIHVTPHMHLIGRDMAVTATTPTGEVEKLVRVPDWDFNWQTTYTFKEPIKVPAGSRIDLVAHYNNSTSNPRNPNSPPKPVTWGEQTTDEMCIAFVGFTIDKEHLTKGVAVQGMNGLGGRRRARRVP